MPLEINANNAISPLFVTRFSLYVCLMRYHSHFTNTFHNLDILFSVYCFLSSARVPHALEFWIIDKPTQIDKYSFSFYCHAIVIITFIWFNLGIVLGCVETKCMWCVADSGTIIDWIICLSLSFSRSRRPPSKKFRWQERHKPLKMLSWILKLISGMKWKHEETS